jgi:iron complex transport system ATP-binding protein
MFEIRNLNFSYGTDLVLKNITFSATAGEFIAIIGPNGAGKSTLIKLMDGILVSGGSDIYLEEKTLTDYSRKELARKIAYLPQDSKFAFSYTVKDVVMMGRFPYLKGVFAYTAEDIRVVKDIMTLMEINHFETRYFNELSGGEKQRVLIASALAQQPKIILLDEPTTALDLHHQIAIYRILKKLQKEQHITIIVVTHDINLAAQYCERMALMGKGMIIRDDKPQKVLQFNLLQETFGVKVYIDINPLTDSLYILPYEE